MHSFQEANSADSRQDNGNNDSDYFQSGQSDCGSLDVMCFVYPDGSTTTIDPQATPS